MATKLCSKHEATAADRCLLGMNNSKLLIIKKRTGWTDKELIVTPCEENFSSAVVYGESSTWASSGSDTKADGETVNNRLKQIWAGKTSESWQAGYKPLISYTARGGCPYMIRSESSSWNNHEYYLEQGCVRRALRFNTYAIPSGSCDSFRAYIRFWNPSFVQRVSQGASVTFSYVHNKGGYVSYHFDENLCAPNQFEANGYGTAKFALNNGESGTWLANQMYTGQLYDTTHYDIWNNRAINDDRYRSTRTHVFKKNDSSTDPYYADHEITGTALELLKKCLLRKSFWMHIGFKQAQIVFPDSGSGLDTGMWSGSTVTLYCSRIEIRLVISWKAMNI